MNVWRSTSSSYLQNMVENMLLTSYLDKSFCHQLRWIRRKHSNGVTRLVEIPGKVTKFVTPQIYVVVRHNFHVALEVILYHDCKKSRFCNRCSFSFATCEVLRPATSFLLHLLVYYKTIIPLKSMFCYILNIKMISQSLSNFTELLACGS